MPPAGIAAPVQHALPPSCARLSDEDRRHVAAMDAAIVRMKKITPAEPYFITVPQEDEHKYRHQSTAQAFQWAREQPFDHKHEREWQQYQTFIFSEPGSQNLLALHSHDSALPKPAAVEKHKNATGTNTPNQAPRKGISLGDYKKKKAGEPIGGAGGDAGAEKKKEQTAKQPALKGPAENLVSKESEEMLAEIQAIEHEDGPEKATKESAPQEAEKASAGKQELKRKREDSAKVQERRADVDGRVSPSPAKKTRTTPPTTSTAKATEKERTRPRSPISRPARHASPGPPSDVPDTNLPPKLSPLREVASHEMLDDSFPGRLTPTLPSNIIASLEKPKHSTAKRDRNLTPSVGQNGVAKHKSPAPRNGFRANSISPAGGPLKVTMAREIPRSTAKKDPPEDPQPQKDHDATLVQETREPLMVRFKFKKSIRGDVRRILAFPPRPSKLMSQPFATVEASKSTINNDDTGDITRRTGKGVAQKVGPSAKKTIQSERRDFSDKRPRIEPEADNTSQQPPAKKVRASEPQAGAAQSAETAPNRKQPKSSQHDKADKKAGADDPISSEQKAAEIPAKQKHQEEAEDQQPAAKKSKADKPQPPESKLSTSAKAPAINGNEQQEATTRKKKPDQARYEPPSRKRSSDASAPQAASKSKSDSLEFKKNPSTPTARDLQSPTVSSANKSVHHTPGTRKDLLSATRHRDTTNDSQTSTPSGLGNTPLTHGAISTSQPPSAQPNGVTKLTAASKTPLQQAWDTERERLEALGRTVKHAASDTLNTKDASADKKTLGACLAIESLLCYLSAYTCADRAALAAADPKHHSTLRAWRSMSGFFAFVQRATRDQPLLAGLAASLGVVLHAHIVDLIVAQQSASGSGWAEHSAALLKVATGVEEEFDVHVVMAQFPKSWKAGSKGNLASEDALQPEQLLNGAFKLPLGVATKPVNAARAGLALLGEFIESSGLEYAVRLSA